MGLVYHVPSRFSYIRNNQIPLKGSLQETVEMMKYLQFSLQSIKDMIKLLTAVIYIGQIEFEVNKEMQTTFTANSKDYLKIVS